MPKAAMHEYDFSPFSEDHIGPAWKASHVKPVTVAHAMDQPAHHHLWPHAGALNPAHVFTAPFP